MPPRRPTSRTVIYEMHVRGMTRHPSSGIEESKRVAPTPAHRKDPLPEGSRHHRGGTASGLRLRRPGRAPGTDNYWGLRARLVFRPASGLQFRLLAARTAQTSSGDLVKAMHRAGIEVILDVVYNHTPRAARMARPWGCAGSRTTPTTLLGTTGRVI